MKKDVLIDLLRYDHWALVKILRASEQLETVPEDFGKLISHVLNAQAVWLDRMNAREPEKKVWEERGRSNWLRDAEYLFDQVLSFLEHHSDEGLDWKVVYVNSKGDHFDNTKNDILLHLILHGQYHRGQLVRMLKGIIDPLPVTDFIHYKRSV